MESRKRKGVLTVTKEKVGSKKEQQRVVHGEPHPLPEQLCDRAAVSTREHIALLPPLYLYF